MTSRGTVPKVLVDASNLHVGGGVQAASSLVDLLLQMAEEDENVLRYPWLRNVDFEVSGEVHRNLTSPVSDRIRIVRRRPWRTLISSVRDVVTGLAAGRDVHFVIFGPHWGFKRGRRLVLGYADVTAVYTSPSAAPGVPHRVRGGARRWGSLKSARSADVLVVESEEFGRTVSTRTGRRVVTVPNTVHQVVGAAGAIAHPANLPAARPDEITLCYVTRAYPHKNLSFLESVAHEVERRGHHVRFVLTLTEAEWASLPAGVRQTSVNLGPQKIHNVSGIYHACDGTFFPSRLEAFSATPIEAMKLGSPLFAADHGFVREACGSAPLYFTPEDADDAARVIVSAFQDGTELIERVADGRRRISTLPSPRDRAENIAKVLNGVMEGVRTCDS